MKMPTFDQLIVPTLKALEKLGGSGNIEEIANEVIKALHLTDDLINQRFDSQKSSQTILQNRLGWARSYLKKCGLLENSERSVWSLTSQYKIGQSINPNHIVQTVYKMRGTTKKKEQDQEITIEVEKEISKEVEADWKETLHHTLLTMAPDAFERLAMRLLREAGFVQVEVTGRSGDGGIDGKGIIKLQNILSYHVVFQCKRYKESVGSGVVRDFRGAMVGRADKGLIITTGTFTRDAVREATRDGAQPIDLIDGEALIEMLKRFRLGVSVEMVEKVEVKNDWFSHI